MMRKKVLNIILLYLVILFLTGCSGEPQQTRRIRIAGKKSKKSDEIEKPKEIKVTKHEYNGSKYRSPFSVSSVGASPVVSRKSSADTASSDGVTLSIQDPGSLKITGVFTHKEDEGYYIVSNPNEFYIVKKGRLYNGEEEEIPDIAAVIKKDKLILITDENKTYELDIPE